MPTVRVILGSALLLAQAAAIIRARSVESRYFCWAPYDALSLYRLDVELAGRALTPGEIERRYRIPAAGRDNRSIQHLKDLIAQYESTYGRHDGARVTLRSSTNGHEERVWRWPAP